MHHYVIMLETRHCWRTGQNCLVTIMYTVGGLDKSASLVTIVMLETRHGWRTRHECKFGNYFMKSHISTVQC